MPFIVFIDIRCKQAKILVVLPIVSEIKNLLFSWLGNFKGPTMAVILLHMGQVNGKISTHYLCWHTNRYYNPKMN